MVTATAVYEGFGQTVATTGSTGSGYGFAGSWGYRTDGDAGLMHVGARYYDAQAGRFITRDTYLNQHPYLYCEHDPVNYLDGSGHCMAPNPGFEAPKPISTGMKLMGSGACMFTVGNLLGLIPLLEPIAVPIYGAGMIVGGVGLIYEGDERLIGWIKERSFYWF